MPTSFDLGQFDRSAPDYRVLGDPMRVMQRRCRSGENDEVLVCGLRRDRFRVDPNVLASTPDVRGVRGSGTRTAAYNKVCAVGPGRCLPKPKIDIINTVLLVATAGVRAAKGEDWKELFRKPSDYDRYVEAKAEREGE